METTGCGASWLNGNNGRQNSNIHNIVRAGLIEINQHFKNGVLQHKYHMKSVDENHTVY